MGDVPELFWRAAALLFTANTIKSPNLLAFPETDDHVFNNDVQNWEENTRVQLVNPRQFAFSPLCTEGCSFCSDVFDALFSFRESSY